MTTQLAVAYSLTPGTNPTLQANYGDYTSMQSSLPYFAGWATQMGLSQAQQLQVDLFSACHNNEVWKTHGYYPGTPSYAQVCNSRANIEWPDGRWNIRMPLLGAMGHYYGQGQSNYVNPGNPAQFTYGTEIRIDHDNWVGLPTITGPGGIPTRYGILAATYGQGDEGAYAEGFRVSDVYLNGNMPIGAVDASFESSGIFLTNAGSCSQISRVKADGWNNAGIHIVNCIPLRIEHCRTFRNNQAGVLFEGCALGTVWVHGLEGDDNVNLIEIAATSRNGMSAGLKTATFSGIKSEQGKNSDRGQCIMYLRGQFGITVCDISSAVYNEITPDTLVRWNTTNGNSALTVFSMVDCGTSTPGGFQHLLRTNSLTYPMPPLCRATSFKMMGSEFYSDEEAAV